MLKSPAVATDSELRSSVDRASAIAGASPYPEHGRSFVDLERGIFYRKQIGKRATKKRQTPAPVPPRLLAHMRRCARLKLIAECFVEFNGKPIASVKKGFKSGVGLAGLSGKVTPPHVAPHGGDLADMQRDVPVWEAAGFLGMSAEVLLGTYGHHHPDFLHGAANATTTKHRVSVVGSVVELDSVRERRQKA